MAIFAVFPRNQLYFSLHVSVTQIRGVLLFLLHDSPVFASGNVTGESDCHWCWIWTFIAALFLFLLHSPYRRERGYRRRRPGERLQRPINFLFNAFLLELI